jgi:osmoprotectant transport system substrate-binding protein
MPRMGCSHNWISRFSPTNRRAFPPYQVCITARRDSLARTPGLEPALQDLSNKFTNRIIQQLNHEVDAEHRPVIEVARDFLKQSGM